MPYELEDIRDFCVRRNWFASRLGIITIEEYEQLKARTLSIDAERADRIRWFINGYLWAKS